MCNTIGSIITQTFSKHLTEWLSCYSKECESHSNCSHTCTCTCLILQHVFWTPHNTAAVVAFFFICLFSRYRVLCITPSSTCSSPLLSTPHPSLHPSSRSPACSSIQAPNRIRRDGRLDIHKLSIHHQRGGGWGWRGGVCGGKTGAQKEKRKVA